MADPSLKASELHRAASALPPHRQAEFLDRACADDPDLRGEVQRLLANPGPESGPLGLAPTSGATEGRGQPAQTPWPVIGPYHVLAVLGHGGMGVVYLAEQREPVRRRVALKVIKPGMDSAQVIARFQAERQALAMMDHPGVAKVLDAGTTDRGLPYFVMEHVPGVPITDFCDTQRLSIPDRLALFIEVCAAVQHAHHKGVIHRDLKPSNILVAFRDGVAAAKVIDFGVAKALGGHLASDTIFTQQGQLVGTPEYMSPEQAEMSALDIDTRSDVYSLGVILYELLTGALPFDSKTLRSAGVAAVQRIIREQDPPRPSTRLGGMTLGRPGEKAPATPGDAADIAAHRKSDTRSLLSILRTDLDWVVLKCLEKDRTRRYETPSSLAADLKRFLASEPVSAGPPSAIYRARKFVRRHRAGVTASALVAVALILGLASTGLALRETARQRDAANRERAAANRERDTARIAADQAYETSNFLENLFTGPDPIISGPDDARRLREALARLQARAGTTLADRPLVAAEAHRLAGSMYDSIADFDASVRELEKAHDAFLRFAGPDDDGTLRTASLLAGVIAEQGKTAEARDLLTKSLDDYRRILGPAHEETLAVQSNLGRLYTDTGHPEQAIPLLRDALDKAAASKGLTDYARLTIKSNLAGATLQSGDLAGAEPLMREVADESRTTLGPDNPRTLRARGDLAILFAQQGRFDNAIPMLVELLPDYQRSFGPDHPETIGIQMNIAAMTYDSGRPEEAEPYFKSALDHLRATRGPTHPNTIICTYNLASMYAETGRYADAEPLARDHYDSCLQARGPTDGQTINGMVLLAEVCKGLGQSEEAAAWQARAERADGEASAAAEGGGQ